MAQAMQIDGRTRVKFMKRLHAKIFFTCSLFLINIGPVRTAISVD